ncbi:SDR family oxidoreductase [Leptospira yasudae]|uniref:dTDP-4-dehydrorhamnose reductase n=1 Tax=Leptospira yasudae TaxID=2202201 RepID=A0ABX9M031_9LEPT|nr:SDR family oxidoreductase [Leptospira yasudae]RHX78252.1 NAD(P)-dependent oxidoreductase [Leptospira yasudae]TGK24536.1 SDR family oxidoreductase [Leptospira yasudae]TGM05678.1 SDR family oxidoreductase [Leptospira yasudae]
MNRSYKVLILGASGMLGSAVYKIFSDKFDFEVWGTIRSPEYLQFFRQSERKNIITNVDVTNQDDLIRIFQEVKPDIVVNCIGIIKQQKIANDPLTVLPINSLLPHKLSNLCKLIGARLILISTDCVFNGRKGMYLESDIPDAEDLYGKSKEIGEVSGEPHVFTMRTSIIGHELNSNYSLVNWFLSQKDRIKGFSKAIFSGFPASEIADIIGTKIIPNPNLSGLYHISSEPISKFDLLELIRKIYDKNIQILESTELVIDRSLDSRKFRQESDFVPKNWELLIREMKDYSEKYLDMSHV